MAQYRPPPMLRSVTTRLPPRKSLSSGRCFGSTWRDDATAYAASCRELAIPAYVEVSRSGDGARVWTFFDSPIAASQARQVASAAITRGCARHRTLAFTSYD